MKSLVLSTVLAALISIPLRAQSTAPDPHSVTPSHLSMVYVHVQPTATIHFTQELVKPTLLPALHQSWSLEVSPRSSALSYTVSEELFESSNRGRNTLKGMLIGGTAGFVVGALVATQLATGCDAVTPSNCTILRQRLNLMALGGVKGASLGAVIGAGIGALR